MGRGIRRLVSLFQPIDALVAEADYRIQVENDGSQFPSPITDEDVEKKFEYEPEPPSSVTELC